ncbi:helix-turn-helix domain-containing protein [Sorangium sp. So ce1389]
MKDLDIAEVARRAGVPASTLRFYEEKGLIASTGRRGLRRLFDPGVLERLALIALGQVAGFSLDEIARMFAPDGRLRIDRERLLAKAEELDGTIQRLGVMRDGLRHAAACSAPSHMECPHFRRIVRLAGAGRLDPPAPPAPGAAGRGRSSKVRPDATGATAIAGAQRGAGSRRSGATETRAAASRQGRFAGTAGRPARAQLGPRDAAETPCLDSASSAPVSARAPSAARSGAIAVRRRRP